MSGPKDKVRVALYWQTVGPVWRIYHFKVKNRFRWSSGRRLTQHFPLGWRQQRLEKVALSHCGAHISHTKYFNLFLQIDSFQAGGESFCEIHFATLISFLPRSGILKSALYCWVWGLQRISLSQSFSWSSQSKYLIPFKPSPPFDLIQFWLNARFL